MWSIIVGGAMQVHPTWGQRAWWWPHPKLRGVVPLVRGQGLQDMLLIDCTLLGSIAHRCEGVCWTGTCRNEFFLSAEELLSSWPEILISFEKYAGRMIASGSC
ncbi:unnamed protein product [Effrenium voratum]|uniref:Uncharacterized protein n=1 Tax=Effrenium voratum TaxID=2562239 RepID=A0AA36MXM9_9DINO|nr:unnamed protein product [Effrenium voratum]CAJ1455759.1 unnamed protein product [Effrenium voratum]